MFKSKYIGKSEFGNSSLDCVQNNGCSVKVNNTYATQLKPNEKSLMMAQYNMPSKKQMKNVTN